MELKIVIFDCDGVLFSSKEANRAFYNKILDKLSLDPMNESELQYCHMHTAEDSIKYLLREHNNRIDNAYKVADSIDYSQFLHLMVMEPLVEETLLDIKQCLLTAILTNRSTTMAKLVEIYKLNNFFDKIVSALDVNKPKPHPEGICKILEYYNIKPEQAIYIGDSIVDQEVAFRTSVPFIAYQNKNLKAMFHVEHFYEIKKCISRYIKE